MSRFAYFYDFLKNHEKNYFKKRPPEMDRTSILNDSAQYLNFYLPWTIFRGCLKNSSIMFPQEFFHIVGNFFPANSQ